MLKKASEILAAIEILTRETDVEVLGFSSRPFVITSFPARPTKEQTWVRRNGNAQLTITSLGQIPFGADRLIPIFLATRAVQCQSRTITFDTVSEVLELFGLAASGINYKRLSASLRRVFQSSVFFEIQAGKFRSEERFHFISKLALWEHEPPTGQTRLPGMRNTITLSEEFYQEVLRHPIPLDIDVVKLLRNKPVTLDLYMFFAYKAATVTRPTSIPIQDLFTALGPGPGAAQGSSHGRVFKSRLRANIELINKLSDFKVTLLESSVSVAPSKRKVKLLP